MLLVCVPFDEEMVADGVGETLTVTVVFLPPVNPLKL